MLYVGCLFVSGRCFECYSTFARVEFERQVTSPVQASLSLRLSGIASLISKVIQILPLQDLLPKVCFRIYSGAERDGEKPGCSPLLRPSLQQPQELLAECRRVQFLYVAESRKHSFHCGQHPEIRRLLKGHPRYRAFAKEVLESAKLEAEKAVEAGRTTVAMQFVCNQGKHRSVAFATEMAESLLDLGYQVYTFHLGMNNWKRKCREGTCGCCVGPIVFGRLHDP